MNPDVFILHAVNGFVGTIPLLDRLAVLLVNDFFVLTLASITVAGIWFSGNDAERRAVIITLVGFALTLAVVKNFWNVYYRPRPFATEELNLLFYRPSVSSFPSLPIAIAFCFASGAALADRRVGILLYALATLYALARVYAGVHFPLDVLGGAIIGSGMVKIATRLGFVVNPLADQVIAFARRAHFI